MNLLFDLRPTVSLDSVVYPLLIVIDWLDCIGFLGDPVVIGFDVMQSDARFYWDWQLSIIAVVFVANFLYSLVVPDFLGGGSARETEVAVSISKMRDSPELCIVVSAIVTMVVFPFMARKARNSA